MSRVVAENNVEGLLSLAEEYQMAVISERCEEFLLTQASSLRNFSLALKYNLSRLHESTLAYMRRVPVVRLKQQAGFEKLDQQVGGVGGGGVCGVWTVGGRRGSKHV